MSILLYSLAPTLRLLLSAPSFFHLTRHKPSLYGCQLPSLFFSVPQVLLLHTHSHRHAHVRIPCIFFKAIQFRLFLFIFPYATVTLLPFQPYLHVLICSPWPFPRAAHPRLFFPSVPWCRCSLSSHIHLCTTLIFAPRLRTFPFLLFLSGTMLPLLLQPHRYSRVHSPFLFSEANTTDDSAPRQPPFQILI